MVPMLPRRVPISWGGCHFKGRVPLYRKGEFIVTKVRVDPGVCGNVATVETVCDDGMEVTIKVESPCEAIMKMFQDLGDTFDSYELCFGKPGSGPLYDYASSNNFPPHCGCITLASIIKAAEAECKLALPKDAAIAFGQ